jgi:hypothetical protein
LSSTRAATSWTAMSSGARPRKMQKNARDSFSTAATLNFGTATAGSRSSGTTSRGLGEGQAGRSANDPLSGHEVVFDWHQKLNHSPNHPSSTSERGSPFTTTGFARHVERTGSAAELDPPARAVARLRLCAGQLRPRHARPAVLFGSQEHSTHGSVHRAVPDRFKDFRRCAHPSPTD